MEARNQRYLRFVERQIPSSLPSTTYPASFENYSLMGPERSAFGLRDQHDAWQRIKMRIAGQKLRAMCLRRGKDDRICRGQLVDTAGLGSSQRAFGIERHDLTDLRESNDLISLVLPDFAGQPFRKFHLHHSRHQPVGLVGQMVSQLVVRQRGNQPFDLGRGVNEDHSVMVLAVTITLGIRAFRQAT